MEEDGEKFGWGLTGKIIYIISLISWYVFTILLHTILYCVLFHTLLFCSFVGFEACCIPIFKSLKTP